MKKTILFAAATLVMVGMAACSGNKEAKAEAAEVAEEAQVTTTTAEFTGVLPAADCEGVKYDLSLTFNAESKDGTFALVETYLENDTTAISTIESAGQFTFNTKDGKDYIVLTKAQEAEEAPMYFVVVDNTLTMTGEDLELPATPGLNYTLVEVAE